jgi:hypothetical protein
MLSENTYRWRWLKDNALFTRAVNSIMINTELPDTSGMSDQYHKLIKIISEEKENFKELFEFQYALTYSGDKRVIEDFINSDNAYIGNNYLGAFYQFYTGLYYYRNENFESAERALLKSFELYKDDVGYKSLLYLFSIYEKSEFPETNVEEFVDLIYDNDIEWLEYRTEDLEEKYDI